MKLLLMSIFFFMLACQPTKSIKDITNSESTSIDTMSNIMNSEIIILKVASQKINCIGAHGNQKCLQIKTPGASK